MVEAVIIGGGIAGFAAALAMHDRGIAVNVVEAEAPGAAATGASGGMLAPQYEAPRPTPLFRLLLKARERYPGFVARVERISGCRIPLSGDGMVVVNRTAAEHEAARRRAEWQRGEGASAEVIGVDDAVRLEGAIHRDAASYLWLPDEGWVDSQALAAALDRALRALDVRVIAPARAAAVRHRNGAVTGVDLADGRRLEADVVVIAAGAWSGTIDGLPRRVPVRPVRGQILRFGPGAAPLSRIVSSHDATYLVPRADGTILAGSTMEEAGFDRSVTDAGLAAVHDAAAELVPRLAGRTPRERWAGLRPISADGRPVLGPDPELQGLFYATGYGRNGILFSPLAGEIVADLVAGVEPEFDWNEFAPERLGGTDASGAVPSPAR